MRSGVWMKSYSPEVITYPVFQPMQLRQINWQLDSKMVFSFKLIINKKSERPVDALAVKISITQ